MSLENAVGFMEYLKMHLDDDPSKGWHVTNVWNPLQKSENEHGFQNLLKEYCKGDKTLAYLPHILTELFRHNERAMREIDSYDYKKINEWILREKIEALTNFQLRSSIYGFKFYQCPHCRKGVGEQEIAEQLQLAKTEYDIVAPSKPIEKLKKVGIGEKK